MKKLHRMIIYPYQNNYRQCFINFKKSFDESDPNYNSLLVYGLRRYNATLKNALMNLYIDFETEEDAIAFTLAWS